MKAKKQKEEPRNLPPMPERIAQLPVQRGYPVPWFVALVNGVYDFRLADADKMPIAVNDNLCWVCGQKLGSMLAFPIGPMCVVNRTISEPPSHRECAEWSIKACPFLTQQQTRRNEKNLPDGHRDPAGVAIKRQPGVICLWLTKSFTPFKAPNGVLFRLGEPTDIFWYREGREATRDEILESIESGLPILAEMAEQDGTMAVRQLNAQFRKALTLVPGEIAVKRSLASAAKR